MRKFIYISLLLMSFFSAAEAQKKFVYEDTSLLQKEEEYVPDEETKVEVVPKESSINDTNESYEPETVDTSLYKNTLYLPYDSVKNWKNLKEYAYTRYLDSLLKNEKKPEPQTQRPSSGPSFFESILNSGFVKILLWTLAICFVLFIIYRLFLAEGVFQRKTKSVENAEAAEEEVITNESNFDTLINTALQNSNYRQAVRYQYLRTLHLLADKDLVELAPDKTNYQYVREISNRDIQNDFASLTLNYEYVWYGEFNIDKELYQKIGNNFISLNQKL